MNGIETLEEFYSEFSPTRGMQLNLSPELGHFNVFRRGVLCKKLAQFSRRDYYKISLVLGKGVIHYPDQSVEVTGKALVFYNPAVPYTWEILSEKQEGFFCLFNRRFIEDYMRDDVFTNSALFDTNVHPVFHLSNEQVDELSHIFARMMKEVESDYVHRYDLLRNYLMLVFHEAGKAQPSLDVTPKYLNASSRITSLFIEILERQFPVDSTEHALKLKTPVDFADRLSVHVNHLNRAVKETTGKSTSELIAGRIVNEAKALLRHTDNTVAEVAYSLGFEHPSNFIIFFKKQMGITPKALRDQMPAHA